MNFRRDIELRWAGAAPLFFDPLRHRYFRPTDADIEAVRRDEPDEAMAVHELTIAGAVSSSSALARRAAARHDGWLKLVLHRYLFLKVPLVRPNAWLDRTLPFVRLLMTRGVAIGLILLAVVGLALVVRRWDEFMPNLHALATWDGIFFAVLALSLVKVLHELGHAFALKRQGGSVPSMGVAFVVLFPILYTDTSDAWLLPRRRQRLIVDLAGVIVELAVAVIATWVWVLLPDGAGREAAFTVAAVSWTLSLLVNLNPFMRFDGYHVLADALDMPNLQGRAFALARWRLRELLFAPNEAPSEPIAPRLRRWLVVYAWTTWLYRLVLFTGIALLVYHATFKLLGIVLFIVEIQHFVLRPIWREVKGWRQFVAMERRRSTVPLGMLIVLPLVLALPLDRSVTLPAVLEVGQVHTVRASETGRLIGVADARTVSRGQSLARIERQDEALEFLRIGERRTTLTKRSVHSAAGLRDYRAHESQLAVLAEARRRSTERRLRQVLIAPVSGRLRYSPGTKDGRTVGRGDEIATIVGEGSRIVALAPEGAIHRLAENASGMFRAEVAEATVRSRVANVAEIPADTISPIELSVAHGGSIVPGEGASPGRPHFPVRLVVSDHTLPPGRWRGAVTLPAEPRSYGMAILHRIHAVFLRESGF